MQTAAVDADVVVNVCLATKSYDRKEHIATHYSSFDALNLTNILDKTEYICLDNDLEPRALWSGQSEDVQP